MLGIDINILFSALFTLLGMAVSIGVVLFIGGRWTARIEEKLRSIDRRFDDVNLRMTEGFAAVHQRIDSLETRIASLEERVSHLDVRMAEIPEVTIDRLMKLFQLREAVIATTTEASKNAG